MEGKKALIGVLAWDGGSSDTLSQLESMHGNILNPTSFDFPLRVIRVKGADYKTIVENPDPVVLENMIAAAKILEQEGIQAITTSCGFNAFFQKELAAAVNIPVFASSLIQVPSVHCSLKPEQSIGIITADKQHLTRKHFANTGISENIQLKVASISDIGEFAKLRDNASVELDTELFIKQVVSVAEKLVKDNPKIGAIVLECTDLPPCASAIRKATGLAVFDIVTLLNMVHQAIA
jgi:Asp/Glu/hydantoin racemase